MAKDKIDIQMFKRQLPGRMHALNQAYVQLKRAFKEKSHLISGLHSHHTFECCHIIEILLKARIQLEGKSYSTGHSLIDYFNDLSGDTKAILGLIYKVEIKKLPYFSRLIEIGLAESGRQDFDYFSWLEYKRVLENIKRDNVNSRYSFETNIKLENIPDLLHIAALSTYRVVALEQSKRSLNINV